MDRSESISRYCLVCGYDLSRQRVCACPECGVAFKPEDRSTWSASPSIAHRLPARLGRLRRWIIEECCVIRCRSCGVTLTARRPERCEQCQGWFDPRDLSTVVRTFTWMPSCLARLGSVSWLGGVLLPALVLWHGIWCVVNQTAFFPSRIDLFRPAPICGAPGTILGLVWIAAAVSMHAFGFWNRIEPHWRWAPIPGMAGIAMALLGVVIAVGLLLFG